MLEIRHDSESVRNLDLAQRLNRAYRNRKKVSLLIYQRTHDLMIAHAAEEDLPLIERNRDSLSNLPDEQLIRFEPVSEEPHQVFVDTVELLPSLITTACNLLVSESDFTPSVAKGVSRAAIKHDKEHLDVAKKAEDLKLLPGVEFIEDVVTGSVGFRSFLRPSGTVTVKTFREIMSAPEIKSTSDELLS